ncbi:MAG: MauE/DoxX family redox-associated membrane protein [Armatimonadota bacterium]
MKRIILHPLFLALVGIAVGQELVRASLDKITHPDLFADIVHDYDMLPVVAINAFALLMPWTELVAGAVLVLGALPWLRDWRRGAGLLSTLLFSAFLIAIAQAQLRGLEIECGCFDVSGLSSSEASWGLFLRDLPLAAGSLLLWRRG